MMILEVMDVCNDVAILRVIKFIKSLLTILQYMVPIILIIMCSYDLVGAMITGEEKSPTSKIVKRFLSAIIIFFIMPVVNLVFNLLGEVSVDSSECWNNANESNITALAKVEEEKMNAKREEEKKRVADLEAKRKELFEQLSQSQFSNLQNGVQPNNAGNMDDVNNPLLTNGGRVVAYARQFIGNKYVYGGTDINNGIDCSGFTQYVFRHFGIELPRTSRAQRSVGQEVNGIENARAGDLICYDGHVAIYEGGNKIVHASNSKPYPKGGIKESNNASYRTIITIRRLVN